MLIRNPDFPPINPDAKLPKDIVDSAVESWRHSRTKPKTLQTLDALLKVFLSQPRTLQNKSWLKTLRLGLG